MCNPRNPHLYIFIHCFALELELLSTLLPLFIFKFPLGALDIHIMSMALRARTGRHRQLYDDHLRLVAGCIPYKMKQFAEEDGGDLISRLEILMISSPNRQDLVFPKGGWENDETVGEAACREALEEAGVRGIISEKELGEWKFRSKSRQESCSTEGACKGYMFALEVTEELDNWPEKSSHERRWVSVRDAWRLCRYDWMREALAAFIRALSGDTALPSDEMSEPSNWCFTKPAATERAIDTLC